MTSPQDVWAAQYTHSDVIRTTTILRVLEERGMQKIDLSTQYGINRKSMYAVLAGTYPASPSTMLRKIETALGINPPRAAEPEPEAEPTDDWEPEIVLTPEEELRAEILKTLAPHTKLNPLSRADLLGCFKGKTRRLEAELDALIVARQVCDVIITRRGQRPVVYLYPAGRIVEKYTFSVAKPTAKTGRRK